MRPFNRQIATGLYIAHLEDGEWETARVYRAEPTTRPPPIRAPLWYLLK